MGSATASDKDPAIGAGTPPFQAVGFVLSSTGYAAARRFKETLAPLDLEPREFALLRALGAAEGDSQQAIAERLMIPPSRMVAHVDALERRGLVRRRANPADRRSWSLHLTAKGRKLLARALELAIALERELCADLSATERAQLLELLARVGARAGVHPGAHAAHAHPALAEEDGPDCPGADDGAR
jgi:DNA-binding MarR family transcriptional regulator